MSTSFIAYFNLPAPRLVRLIHTPAQPEGLFASSFTSLRVLDASVGKHFPWPTATLSNLVILRLNNSRSTRRFCATSLFDLIKRTHQLEELQLIDFLRFSGGSSARPIVCTNLKSIHFIQCNVKFILQRLQFPNATSVHVESHGIGSDGEPDLPPSNGIGYFTPLESSPIPILDQQIVTGVTIHMQDWLADNICFKLDLRCGGGQMIDFRVMFQKVDGWEDYFQSSIKEILHRIRFGARVNLSTFHYLPLSPINPPPCQALLSSLDMSLLRLPQVAILRTDYSLVRSVILHLADLEDIILPSLKCYSFDIETQPASVGLAAPGALACLRSRFNNGSPFAFQYWTLDGAVE
jgi:hypothetical protein